MERMGIQLESGCFVAAWWLIQLDSGLWRELKEWEVYFFETALEAGENIVQYSLKSYDKWYRYEVNVLAKTQTNLVTGKVRPLLRIALA